MDDSDARPEWLHHVIHALLVHTANCIARPFMRTDAARATAAGRYRSARLALGAARRTVALSH